MLFPKGFDEIRPFLARREIILIGDIIGGPESQDQVIAAAILYLNAVSSESITFFIDSCGGSRDISKTISDVIRNSAAPVHGVVISTAYSAAFEVIQACHKRMAYPNALLMFHGGSITVKVDDLLNAEIISKDTVKLGTKQVDMLKKRISRFEEEMKYLAERSGQSLDLIKKWWREERFFSASEAKELGFIDEIVEKPK